MKTKITYNEIKAQRARYMAQEITHDEYYLWYAEQIGLSQDTIVRLIGADKIRAATSAYFNKDIPMKYWDNLHFLILNYAKRSISSPFGFSNADGVCIAKSLAKKWKEENENNTKN